MSDNENKLQQKYFAEEQKQELDVRNLSELEMAFELADSIVTKNYLSNLEQYEIVTPSETFLNTDVCQHAGLFKVDKIVYDRNENNLQKLVNIYASAVGLNSGIVMIVNNTGKNTDLYLGTTACLEDTTSARAVADSLISNFKGNFPGSGVGNDSAKETQLDAAPVRTLLKNCTKENYEAVSSVSGIGSVRESQDVDNENYIQGIEKMIDAMQGTPFSAIFIANLIQKEELADIKAEYEILYSKLMPFLKSELTFSESSSDSVSKTLSKSLSKTVTSSRSSALSVGTNESTAHTEGEAKTNTTGVHAHLKLGEVFSAGGSHSRSRTKSFADTTTFGTTRSTTDTVGNAEAIGEIEMTADGRSKTDSTSKSLQISYENKTIRQLLDRIEEQLERIRESENFGVFAAAAYFLTETPVDAKRVASTYKSLISGNCTHVENAHINCWYDHESVDVVKQYLCKLRHPVFTLPDGMSEVSPASVVSCRELAVQLGLPKKSIQGISVIETAAFGRNILSNAIKSNRKIELGVLYHMGRDEAGTSVNLDVDSLAMHTFITGSTGSGKSNAIYTMLEKAIEKKISFMVIEPAKGEYKDYFGSRDDVRVLGTNPKKTELLHIDPFSFPDDIHVLEHIDRLIEIFNVCWPMYAAMPAVLKDAVERAYISAGWDLGSSECKYVDDEGKSLYPCFADILGQINAVIEESKYSENIKGDYAGALCTRIKSLTNGLYGQIFTSNDIPREQLYDKNVIVDLSRVGSSETKALIMGLLVIGLQEYRMSAQNESNTNLQHLTVLEEAHNLLRRTSTEQSTNNANLLGKSVEMLANSIAEMRTYGEGFIIADQAPGLLDMSVIRNTNTKIILRLPDLSDRELVGRAASLNDSQILEISRLQTGVAAVYQNDWLEPVLCHISRAKTVHNKYEYEPENDCDCKSIEKVVDYLMMPVPEKLEQTPDTAKMLEQSVYRLRLSSETKVNILRYISEKRVKEAQKLRSRIIYGLFNSEVALSMSNYVKHDIRSWYNMMLESLEPDASSLDATEKDKILAIIANENANRRNDSESTELFNGLMTLIADRRAT